MTEKQAAAYDAAQPDPRKPGRPIRESEAATGQIQLRVTMARKNAYVRAAKPKKLTEWIFENLDKAARHAVEIDTHHPRVHELAATWTRAEQQYRAQVAEARAAGTPWQGMLAHADQLGECRRLLLQSTFDLPK